MICLATLSSTRSWSLISLLWSGYLYHWTYSIMHPFAVLPTTFHVASLYWSKCGVFFSGGSEPSHFALRHSYTKACVRACNKLYLNIVIDCWTSSAFQNDFQARRSDRKGRCNCCQIDWPSLLKFCYGLLGTAFLLSQWSLLLSSSYLVSMLSWKNTDDSKAEVVPETKMQWYQCQSDEHLTALVCVTFDSECNHTLLDFPDASFGVYTYIALVTLLHTYKLVAILNYSVLHPVYTKRESIPETTGSCNMFLYETCRWQTAQFGAPNISKCAVLRTSYQ